MKIYNRPKNGADSTPSASRGETSTKAKRDSQSPTQIEQELRQLKVQVASLTQDLEACRAELTAADLAASVLRRHEPPATPFTLVEPRNDSLINLFVAAARLHANLDRPGVLAHVFDHLRRGNINVQETENVIFEGAQAAVARINLDGAPSDAVLRDMQAGNSDILDLHLVMI